MNENDVKKNVANKQMCQLRYVFLHICLFLQYN